MNEEAKTPEENEGYGEEFIERIVSETVSDFKKRQAERVKYERQWLLNVNFFNGNQYCDVNAKGEIVEKDNEFFWQRKDVFNHIAPIIETRLAKFSRVKPDICVRARSTDDDDVMNANLAEKLIESAFKKCDMPEVSSRVNTWSEICGTAFYKILWNNKGGRKLGAYNGEEVFEGEVEILPVSPFEIFPDSLFSESIEDCASIIHAKAVPIEVIKEKYGVTVSGENVDVYGLSLKDGVKRSDKTVKNTIENAAILIEKYEKPTKRYPLGRMITVAGDKLLFYGDLPYENGENGTRSFPFVKQESLKGAGCFFGNSVIERLIPVQKSYNAVKNRKHEFLNRLSTGIMTVEDGACDLDDLSEDGLAPGKVLVYRQGAKAPEMMENAPMPPDFNEEEDKLLQEFVTISGVADVSSSKENARLSSGSALRLLIEQDNERLTVTAEIIRKSLLGVAKKILRLYRQFVRGIKAISIEDDFSRSKVYYADQNAAANDDVYLESENELTYTPEQKREKVLKLYESGVLNAEDGKMKLSVKEKVLSLLGYKDLDSQNGVSRLHEEKAQSENEKIRKFGLDIEEIDDDAIHIDEHTRYDLSEYDELKDDEKTRLFEHIKKHKERLKDKKSENVSEQK